MKRYEQMEQDRVLEDLASTRNGLSPEEAGRRLKQYGRNALQEGKRQSLLQV
ncbi:MAG TPA: hypothetical protein DCF42_06810, partial [Lachnospiraceae bacterium]|nr:hypothetical protein [Lachnospiraceae bacterium]